MRRAQLMSLLRKRRAKPAGKAGNPLMGGMGKVAPTKRTLRLQPVVELTSSMLRPAGFESFIRLSRERK
jgi:hypothetical protein